MHGDGALFHRVSPGPPERLVIRQRPFPRFRPPSGAPAYGVEGGNGRIGTKQYPEPGVAKPMIPAKRLTFCNSGPTKVGPAPEM